MSYFFSELISGVYQSNPNLFCLLLDVFSILCIIAILRLTLRAAVQPILKLQR